MAETLDDPLDTKLVPDEAKAAPVVVPDPAPTDGKVVPKDDVKPMDKPADKPPEKVVDPTWPADWREKASAGDEKKLAKLSRYASPQAVADALLAAQAKLGEKGTRLPKDATPEQVSAWRQENGIPEDPKKYDLKLDGVDLEQDKALVDAFLTSAHASNMTGDQVKASLKTYYEMVDSARQARVTQDSDLQVKAEDELRAEWGADYRRNINLVTNLLGDELKDKVLLGRLSDGTPIGSSPEMLRFLTSIALERNPTGVITPSGVTNEATIDSEIAKIEDTMRKNRSAYNKDEKMQERYRQLLTYKAKQKG